MADEKTIKQKLIQKESYEVTTGIIKPNETWKVWGENKLRVVAPSLDGSGVLAVQAKLAVGDTWTNIGQLDVNNRSKTFDISTWDVIRLNMLTAPNSVGEVAVSAFFSQAGVKVETDSGEINSSDLAIKGGTDINVQVVNDEIIINSTASAGAGLSSYTHSFLIADWVLNAGEYVVSLAALTHGLGTAVDVHTYEDLGTVLAEVDVVTLVDDSGNINIKINASPDVRFDGRLHVKEQ